MIRIFLLGGLGNLLFQLNYLHLLKERYPDHTFGVSNYIIGDGVKIMQYLRLSDHGSIHSLVALGFNTSRGPIDLLLCVFLNLSKFFSKSILRCTYFGRELPSKKDVLKSRNIMGYFQHNVPVSESFRTSLIEKVSRLPVRSEVCREVVVHFRGGDFTPENEMKLMQYYRAALRPFSHATVVTNDALRAETFFKQVAPWLEIVIPTETSELEDFAILSRARNLICSNSTFCWWAAEVCNGNIIQPNSFYDFPWEPKSLVQRKKIDTEK